MLILKKNDSAVPFRVRLFFVAVGRQAKSDFPSSFLSLRT